MSFKALTWVMESSASEGSDRLVMFVLAEAMNKHGDDRDETCWPSKATIAGKARLSERTVQRCIQNLIDLGELASQPHPDWQGRADRRPNVYRFKRGDNLTPRENERGDNYDTNGETGETERGDTAVSQTIKEPQVRTPTHEVLEFKDGFGMTIRVTEDEVNNAFEEFWKNYPRHEGKQAAKRKYLATLRKGATPGELLDALANFVRAVHGREPRYVKHAATFLGPDEHWREYLVAAPDAYQDSQLDLERIAQEMQ